MAVRATFSVVIPAYNARATLARAVRSVLAQGFEDFELIVVDDGSTDGGAATLPGDPRLRLLRQDNAGEGPARNRGVEAARHDWVAFLDADDLWLPEHLAELDRIRRRHPQAALIGTRAVESGFDGRYRLPRREEPRIEAIGYFERVARDPRPFVPSSAAARRDAVLAAGGFRPFPLGADSDLFARLALRHPVAASTRVTAVYVRGTGGATERARERWRGAELRSAADLAPAVATALAADPPPPGLDAFVDRYVGWCLRSSVQIADVETIRRLPSLYRSPPPRADRVLLALGRLPPAAAARLRRPATLLSRIAARLARAG